MEGNTTALRSAAPQWSLAGDKQLLDILNNIHQSLVTRCQEVNRKLDEMVSALDGASVDLQNVNNKFMALSNSQFIESRVYDDDLDVANQEPPKETEKPPSADSEITQLKRSVATLVAAHDAIEILASDSDDDDDDDDEARVVLKPKDVYSHRPLPHIIGSIPWRNKWHAGLHPEDSDSDSSTTKQARGDDDYSDSEPEVSAAPPAREASTASSELPSEQDTVSAPPKLSPADVAAELARRLGGNVQIPIQETEYAAPVVRKIYKPEHPTPGTIFSDEPPPLDDDQSEASEEPDDIFAELHKSRPYEQSIKDQGRLAEDLFAELKADSDSDFRDSQPSSTAAKQNSTLFEDDSEPELFVPKQDRTATTPAKPDAENVKKPIGGISLFGNTQGAESIGAAILRRNRRKSSSDEETKENITKHEEPRTNSNKNKEKDIFDDLFAKSEKEQKMNAKKLLEKAPVKEERTTPKVDLFSDNIFDDIDDIFTTTVTKTVKNDTSNQKSLFDDDDDMFSGIAVAKNDRAKFDSKVDKNKSIFDSDDDLFTENVVQKPVEKIETKKIEHSSKENANRLLESEIDDIFAKSNIKNDDLVVNTDVSSEVTNNKSDNHKNVTNNDSLNNLVYPSSVKEVAKGTNDNKIATKSIFDDDDDENDDLFSSTATKSSTSEHNTLSSSQTQSVKSKDQKSSLFDDDSDDNDLFGTKVSSYVNNDKKSINNNDNNQSNDNKSGVIKKSNSINDLVTDNMFADTKQSNVQDTAIKESNKTSIFDDEDEMLFTENSRPPIQGKPKPEIMKKPTIAPKNNTNITKSLDDTKKPEEKEDNKHEHYDKISEDEYKNQDSVTKQKSNVLLPNATKEDPSSKILKVNPLVNVEQNKINLNKEKIESKLPPGEKAVSITDDKKIEPISNKIESKIPVVVEKPVDNSAHQSNTDFEDDTIESVLPEPSLEVPPPLDDIDNNDYDIFAEKSDESSTKDTFHTPNVFDDIFSEPPAFEKSKEPKKSKNINALFDDDSDDEALFFKKNEPILEEKPDLSPDVSKDGLFGIFHDEPPAIEVDFTQKPTKSSIDDDFLKSDSDDLLFGTKIKITKEKPESTGSKELNTNIENKLTHQKKESTAKIEKPLVPNLKPQLDLPKPEKESQIDITDGEPKKVGKLKTMNFSIDVSTLLPGASPKKKALEQVDTKSNEDLPEKESKKSLEQTDGQIFAKSSEDLHCKEKIEPLMVKSVSFEGEPDSQVLDNKISKERVKIQVKRRPSTRRARKEAVRKSAIDFGDDSTDNSSSVDDPPKTRPTVNEITASVEDSKDTEKSNEHDTDLEPKLPGTVDPIDLKLETEVDMLTTDVKDTKLDISTPNYRLSDDLKLDLHKNNDEVDSTSKLEDLSTKLESNTSNMETSDIFSNITYSQRDDTTVEEIKDTRLLQETKSKEKIDSTKTVTSKIVYILNDEDIFSTPAQKTEFKSNNIDIGDDLFKNNDISSKTTEGIPSISTLGNVYKETNTNESKISKKDGGNKKSLFDDLTDDENELFNNKKATTKPKSILDSDSEEDLFGGKKKETKDTKVLLAKETKDVKKVEVKASLFGDEDDDDDLFGAKVKSSAATSSKTTKSIRDVVTKSTEPVFDDPLSLLGDDD